jgi:hypothetical protein
MWLWTLVLEAQAAPQGSGFQSPNSILAVSVGSPTLLSIRGSAWLGDEIEGELGVGADQFDDLVLGFDYALRWRPDFACFGCGERVLVTIGLGIGGTVVPPPGFDGPWAFSAGPDLAANLVGWVSPTVGLQLGVRGGIGPAWVGTEFGEFEVEPWGFVSAGVAF